MDLSQQHAHHHAQEAEDGGQHVVQHRLLRRHPRAQQHGEVTWRTQHGDRRRSAQAACVLLAWEGQRNIRYVGTSKEHTVCGNVKGTYGTCKVKGNILYV